MSAERPWMKFYPQDWRADERLRNCSLAARGLWLELIALMHRSERYGFLLINRKAPGERALAIQAGAAVDEVRSALAELEAEGVFSRDPEGLIYSRRMIRDEEKHLKASNFGKRGARVKARKGKDNQPPLEGMHEGSLEGAHKAPLKLRDQRPESPPVSPKLKGPVGKHPIPDDWEPGEFGEGSESRQIVESWAEATLKTQIESFMAHHRREGSRYSNWQAAWSTWVLNSRRFAERDERRGHGGSSSGGGDPLVDSVIETYGPRAGAKAE